MSPIVSPDGSATTMPPPLSRALVVRGPRSLRSKRPPPVTREAQCRAAAILEVLAGGRTPGEAATAIGVSLPRYYLLEQRALAGLVAACEPRAAGKGQSPQRRIAGLEKELTRLRQECSRQRALVRASQRTIGLAPPPAKPLVKPGGVKTVGKTADTKSRARRPVVRALRAAAAIRAAARDEAHSSGAVWGEVLQPGAAGGPSPPATPPHVAPALADG
jgi:hypothetical protein